MLSDALPPARNPHSSPPTRLLRFVSLRDLLLSFALLNGCFLACSAATKPLTSPRTNARTRSLKLAANLSPGEVGLSYNVTVNVSGGTAPYRFSVSWGQLPPGLVLGEDTGTISGRPVAKGTFYFGIHVTDSEGAGGAQPFQLLISEAAAVVVTVTPLTTTVVSGGSAQFSALITNSSNQAVTWLASSGTISSTGVYQAPSVSGNTTVTVTAISVADPSKSGRALVTITANQSPSLTITTTSLFSATSGTAYSNQLSASAGTPPYSWTLTSGALPSGIALQAGGTVSGMTSQYGQFNITFQVADSSWPQQTAARTFVLTVSAAAVAVNLTPTTASIQSGATQQFTALVS